MLTLQPIGTTTDLAAVRVLLREYAEALGVDLGFQGFEDELRDLPGEYAAPRGTLILARDDTTHLGCVGVRPLGQDIAEMKRLYVRREARNLGLGRKLAQAAIQHAREVGYRAMRLDTLPQMVEAQALYRSLGFHPVAPYRHNPIPGTAYLELTLASRSDS
jgi:ribosomal protein S18 acetylase RimI-like enzyme